MLAKNILCKLLVLMFSSSALSSDLPPRIARAIIDKRNVQKLYIAHGRSSILIFPCNIKTFSPGPTKDISAALNKRDSKILEVWLSNNANQPAGLKVICNDNYFAFDVIPSNTTHQDFLEVKGAYGIPAMVTSGIDESKSTVLISSKTAVTTANRNRIPRVIRVISSSSMAGEK